MINSAIITPVLAAGSASPNYLYQVNISQRLCSPTCVGQTPMFDPSVSLVGYSSVGTGAYVATINVQGVISYTPCGNNNCCCTRNQLVNQNFTVPFVSTTAPTSVGVTRGTPVNAVIAAPCQSCSRSFVCEVPVTLNVSTT